MLSARRVLHIVIDGGSGATTRRRALPTIIIRLQVGVVRGVGGLHRRWHLFLPDILQDLKLVALIHHSRHVVVGDVEKLGAFR